jgi:hypothetical protein
MEKAFGSLLRVCEEVLPAPRGYHFHIWVARRDLHAAWCKLHPLWSLNMHNASLGESPLLELTELPWLGDWLSTNCLCSGRNYLP